MDVKLIIFKTDGSKKEIAIRNGRYVIGRKPTASLRIPLPSVSREHCELVLDGGGLRVRDLGSSNGTFRNSQRVKETRLQAGDVLAVGPVQMTIQIDGKPSQVVPPARMDDEDEEGLTDTPPEGASVTGSGSADRSALEETITKKAQGAAGRLGEDDSSVFDFDFDFEDDDRPRL